MFTELLPNFESVIRVQGRSSDGGMRLSNSGDFDGSNQFPFCITASTEREIPKWPFVYKCDFARDSEQSKFALVKSDFVRICSAPLCLRTSRIIAFFTPCHLLFLRFQGGTIRRARTKRSESSLKMLLLQLNS